MHVSRNLSRYTIEIQVANELQSVTGYFLLSNIYVYFLQSLVASGNVISHPCDNVSFNFFKDIYKSEIFCFPAYRNFTTPKFLVFERQVAKNTALCKSVC